MQIVAALFEAILFTTDVLDPGSALTYSECHTRNTPPV